MLTSLPSIAYYQDVARRDFVYALARLPEEQWTLTGKRRWICARLGLYSPLMTAGWNGYSVRSGVVYAQSLSAYAEVAACRLVLKKLLRMPGINRYKAELVREFTKYNPCLAILVINSLPATQQTIYHNALKSALHYKQYVKACNTLASTNNFANYQRQRPYFLKHINKHPDLLLLDSNWQARVASDKLRYLNQYLALHHLPPLGLKDNATQFNSLSVIPKFTIRHHPLPSRLLYKQNNDQSPVNGIGLNKSNTKVTVLITVYNAENYLESTLRSLLNQSWQNIELIAVDDASTDSSLSIAQRIARTDKRLTVLNLHQNVGTYVAKNHALRLATGNFIVCHDSDDWAHPLKIEQQVWPLLVNNNLMATTSSWVKIDLEGRFVARAGWPYLNKNPSSLLFRRQAQHQLMQTCFNAGADKYGIDKDNIDKDDSYRNSMNKDGVNQDSIWQPVRTGADSELIERFKLIFGKDSIHHINKPLTLGGHHETSLMNAKNTGTKNIEARIKRLRYWESWRRQHIHMVRKEIL